MDLATNIYGGGTFVPAPDLAEWMMATFINEDAALLNDDHQHLRSAEIGVLWTDASNTRAGRTIVGQAELMPPGGAMGKWQKGRALQQILQWFGRTPDFLVTVDARYAAQCDDASFCALLEHELYHCGQERDEFGNPKFHRDSGLPVFAMRGHDVEEFIGVVRRYGAAASNAGPLVEAARHPPEVGQALLAGVCGICLRAAA